MSRFTGELRGPDNLLLKLKCDQLHGLTALVDSTRIEDVWQSFIAGAQYTILVHGHDDRTPAAIAAFKREIGHTA